MRKHIALAALAVAAALTALPAGAAPRGVNGQISYDRRDPATPDDTFAFVANPDGSHERQLIPEHTCCVGWSPDGTQLALPRETDDGRIATAIVNADGSGYTPLPLDDPTLNVGCGTGSWSPDGSRLACETWDDATPGRNGIYTMATDGTGLTRLTTNPLGGHDIPGDYAPNGKSIVFVRFDADGNSVGLFVARADGSDVHQLTAAGTALNIGADWSPQGNEILFSRHVTPDARGSLWVIHSDGTGLRELQLQGLACGGLLSEPDSIGCHEPRWSPDGKRLVFDANTRTARNVYVADADGSGLVQASHGGSDDDPDWGTAPVVP